MRTLRRWKRKLRERLLEHRANEGLGGPPNHWANSPVFHSNQHGMSNGVETFNLSFLNDAFDVGLWIKHTDDEGRYALMLSAGDFRKVAVWYLWRWIWGEWFGLRRWLFYRWLKHHVASMTTDLNIQPVSLEEVEQIEHDFGDLSKWQSDPELSHRKQEELRRIRDEMWKHKDRLN